MAEAVKRRENKREKRGRRTFLRGGGKDYSKREGRVDFDSWLGCCAVPLDSVGCYSPSLPPSLSPSPSLFLSFSLSPSLPPSLAAQLCEVASPPPSAYGQWLRLGLSLGK